MTVSEHAEELRELAEWERPRIEFLDTYLPAPPLARGEAALVRWMYSRAISFAYCELFEPDDPPPIAFLRSLATTGFNLPIPTFGDPPWPDAPAC